MEKEIITLNFDDDGPERWWVVLADGTLLDDLTPEQYDRYSNAGETIDGGRC